VTIETINEEMLDWFQYWVSFLKKRKIREYFSVIPTVLKTLDMDWGEWDEESA